jgi:LuxR family maltose regulon positive regulatory protein
MPPLKGLLQTKLIIPPVPQNQVSRSRLIGRLNEGRTCALTLVSASAGSGKTTLLSEWARHCDYPVAWISLDRRDNDPARFGSYLFEALCAHGLDLPDNSTLDPQDLEDTLLSALATGINQMVVRQSKLALVLDDYHLIDNPAIHAALIFFVENLPAGARVILSTRVDPPFPLARLRGRGQIDEVRFDSLRFTSEEAAAFLSQRVDGRLDAQEVKALIERTEGWVSGLQLAALSLRGAQDAHALIESFAGDQRYIQDYLVDEVFGQQPQEVQDFLLKTSILEQLCGPLCSAVTLQLEGQAMLEALENANLFLTPLDQNRHWYRYHHLFAEMLRDRLARRSPHGLSELHLRAAAWYAQNGLPADAIDHALSAGDFHYAATLIERFAEGFWMKSQVTNLLRWIRVAPIGVRRSRPRLSLWEAWALLLTGEWEQVDLILDTVEEILEHRKAKDSDPVDKELKGMLAAMRAFRSNTSSSTDAAIGYANQALEALPKDNLNWHAAVAQILGDAYRLQGDVSSASRAYAHADATSRKARNIFSVLVSLRYQAEMQVQAGHLQQAESLFQKALRYAQQQNAGHLSAAGTVHISLGSLYYQKGEHERARRHLEQGLAACERADHGIGLVLANCALARLCQALGEDHQAHLHLDLAEQHAESHDLKQLYWYPKRLRTLLYLNQAMKGGLDPARLKMVDQSAEQSNMKVEVRLRSLGLQNLIYARLLVLQGMIRGECSAALDYLDALINAATLEGKTEYQVVAWILRARALHWLGDTTGSIQALIQALKAGEKEGFVQAFLDEGEEISKRLHELLIIMPQHPVAGFAARVLVRFDKQNPGSRRVVEKLFSARELDVLHLMAEGRTNRQIAKDLVVAESTVKTHLHHIYRKLKVSNRTQAIHRLQSMELLSTS